MRELANANRREARDRFYVFTWGFVAGLAAMGALFVLMLALAALAQ